MFPQLLRNLPGFFNRDPEPVLALRILHPLGLRWSLFRDLLTVRIGGEEPPLAHPVIEIDLRDQTVARLAQQLTDAHGLTVSALHPDAAAWPATRLIPGSGVQGLPQTVPPRPYSDGLYASASILWAHLRALAQELGLAETALAAMLRQLILPHAREEWADYWGWHFGIPRQTDESDADYTQRIMDEFYRARNNPVAMVNNVRRYTGADIELLEPWTRMWTLSRSGLSRGDDHLPSGDYYAYHWLHPIARRPGIDWQKVLPVLHADRPAGTLLIDPADQWSPFEIDGQSIGADGPFLSREDRYSLRLYLLRCGLLSENLTLSQHCVTRNYPFMIWAERFSFILAYPVGWIGTWSEAPWTVAYPGVLGDAPADFQWRTFCKGEIVLSEAPPLGDFQGRFPGFQWIEIGGPLRLSDQEPLSDYPWRRERRPVDEWQEQGQNAAVDLAAVQGTLTAYRQALHSLRLTTIDAPWPQLSDDAPWIPQAYAATRFAEQSSVIVAYPPVWLGGWSPAAWETAQPGPWPRLSWTSETAP